ncbi:MAG: hypothetical protein WCX31_13080 [Salinivirgaceae bacterium]|jgi:hypothetical protein
MSNYRYTKQNLGQKFEFTLIKQVHLAVNNEEFYIIEDDQNSKFLLLKKQYLPYHFKIGQKITCNLDKINCSGQLFFEPENPYYKVNQCYSFNLIEIKTIENYLGFQEKVALVTDAEGNEQWIRNANGINSLEFKVDAFVLYIKKGKLFLIGKECYEKGLRINAIADFKVVDEIVTTRFNPAYILEDLWGNKHAIPKALYSNYNLKIGQWIKATIQKASSKGFFYIEPLHPHSENDW